MKFNSLPPRLAALGCGALLAASAHAAPFTNGGFETGNFAGWTVTNAATGSDISVQNNVPHTGSFYARFGAAGATFDAISQAFDTIAGASYTVSYWLRTDVLAGGPNDAFQFNWDGGAVEDSFTNQGNSPYTLHTATRVASSASTTISFAARNVPGYDRLDDVSVDFLSGPPPVGADVPEPASLALVGLAGALACASRRRKTA